MQHIIPGVLNATQIAEFRAQLAGANWGDGRVTAGPGSARVKANRQVAEDCPIARALGQTLTGMLERHPQFLSAALPRHIYPPLFNAYGPGMHFGAHVDNALRQVPGTPYRIRTDLSATLFLADPAEYAGGELIIHQGDAATSVKLAAGDMILYPADTLHAVNPVTSGERLASFFWVQSLVRNAADRALLFDMDCAIQDLAATDAEAQAVLRLTNCYHNLIRRWSDL